MGNTKTETMRPFSNKEQVQVVDRLVYQLAKALAAATEVGRHATHHRENEAVAALADLDKAMDLAGAWHGALRNQKGKVDYAL